MSNHCDMAQWWHASVNVFVDIPGETVAHLSGKVNYCLPAWINVFMDLNDHHVLFIQCTWLYVILVTVTTGFEIIEK